MAPAKDDVPAFDELLEPAIQALRDLGGSASNDEMLERVIEQLDLPEEVIEVSHLGSETQTEISYRLAWARTYLKKYGALTNSARGVWALTEKGRQLQGLDTSEVKRQVRAAEATKRGVEPAGQPTLAPAPEQETDWRDQLVDVMKQMDPGAFERLCQRVLRESGFVEVEVTQRGPDGGIDGKGLVKLGGLLSFPIAFQCKRYQDAVSSPIVRNFRGAIAGRADRGLIMTTGRFTKDAQDEATRDGVPPIDLVDGKALAEKLREYDLGVTSTPHITYDVNIDDEWFSSL